MAEEVGAALVDSVLTPLPDESAPCGPDLEYDPAFLALQQAAAGKPETQWAPAEPPDWREVRLQAEALMERSRDLRLAVLWLRAMVHVEGFAALPQGLQLVLGLLERFWDTLHPLPDPDDGDPYARMNALALLREPEGLIGDLRQAVLFQQRGLGELRLRTVEVALGTLPPRNDETALSRGQLEAMLGSALEQEPQLRDQVRSALQRTKALISLLNDKVGIENAVDLKPLYAQLNALSGLLPEAADPAEAPDDASADAEALGAEGTVPGAPGGRARKGLSGSVESRDDALRAIDMVCDYLERTEPTNPAQLLLRRARRLVNRNFLQLMKELAPDALNEVARVMGVDPDSVQLDDSH